MKSLLVLFVLKIAFVNAMINSDLVPNQPYMAYVTFIGPTFSFYGGGALISTSHVLTCAANIQGFVSWRVGLGSNRRTDHTTVESNLARAHPNYAEANNVRINDIGIIFLNQPVALSTEIFPIFLPPIDPPAHPFDNVQGMIMGFASEQSTGNQADNNLQAAYVRAMEHSACTQLYMTADPQQHFCANDLQNNSNFCLGDQGGAVTIFTRGEEFLVGVASLPGCGDRPSLYTRVNVFRTWIRTETGI